MLKPVNTTLGDAVLRFEDLALYDAESGVKLDEPTYRKAEANLF